MWCDFAEVDMEVRKRGVIHDAIKREEEEDDVDDIVITKIPARNWRILKIPASKNTSFPHTPCFDRVLIADL